MKPPWLGGYSRLLGVVCWATLSGCQGNVSNDSPDGDSVVDDSAVDSPGSDSDPPDSDPCVGVEPLDLEDGPQVLGLVVAMPLLREVQERTRFGLSLSDNDCPSNETLPEEDGLTGVRYIGGCETADGVRIEGSLERRTGPSLRRWSGDGWSVQAPSGAAYALDGTWSVEDLDVTEGRAREERMQGRLLALSGEASDLRDQALPMGFTGDYSVDRSTDGAGVEVHVVGGALELPCRGSVDVRFETLHSLEGCPDNLPDGVDAGVSYEGREARLIGEAPRSCERCWTHELDGVALGEVCF